MRFFLILFSVFLFGCSSSKDVNTSLNKPRLENNIEKKRGKDYELLGRLPLRRPIPNYICQNEGRVVVAIQVDRAGKVISATPGVKGSTTTDKCLLNQSKKAALKTTWKPDPNAPEHQLGKVAYNFSLH